MQNKSKDMGLNTMKVQKVDCEPGSNCSSFLFMDMNNKYIVKGLSNSYLNLYNRWTLQLEHVRCVIVYLQLLFPQLQLKNNLQQQHFFLL